MDLWQMFWGCLTLVFLVIFAYEAVKQIKGTIVHYYFRGKAHYDVEREFDNGEQLKQIEKKLKEQTIELRFFLSDSNKPTKDLLDVIIKNQELIKQLIDERDSEGK